MPTAKEMIVAVGNHVTVRCEELRVTCIVVDVKQAYGRTRLLVMPVCGEGSIWVEEARVVRVVTEGDQAMDVRRNGDR